MKKGFTLIELLVVILIIGILAAVALPQYRMAVEKIRLAEALTKVDALKKAMDLYISEHGIQKVYFIDALAYKNGNLTDLDIDVTSDIDCNQDTGLRCYSKYFRYLAECSDSGCDLQAERTIKDDVDEYDAYGLDWKWTPNETTRKACWYEGPVSEKICNGLSSLGWEPREN